MKKRVYQYDLDGNYIRAFESSKEAGEKYGISCFSIALACQKKIKVSAGFQWSYRKYLKILPVKSCVKSINQYSIEGIFIQSFSNAAEAEKQTGISKENIRYCARKQKGSAGGYQWRYEEDVNGTENIESVTEKKKIVYQYDLDGNYIQEFASAKEAGEKYGITSIHLACQKKIKTSAGFQWSYQKYKKIPSFKSYIKAINQYSIEGNFIQSFSNASEAEKQTGISKGRIRYCAKNKKGLVNNYQWRYADDVNGTENIGFPTHSNYQYHVRIEQYDKNGKFLDVFENVTEAVKALKQSDKIRQSEKKMIIDCCNQKLKTAYGYIWKIQTEVPVKKDISKKCEDFEKYLSAIMQK